METYAVRLWLPDRPGALGAVASRVGAVRGSVVGIEILEVGEGMAVDELVVQLPQAALVDLLVTEVEEVDGVRVEEVRSLGQGVHDPRLDALETAARLVGAGDAEELLASLCELAGKSLGSEWIAVVDLQHGEVCHGDGPVPPGPWLRAFLAGSRSGPVPSPPRSATPMMSSGHPCRAPDWPWWRAATAVPIGHGSGASSTRWPASWTPGFAT